MMSVPQAFDHDLYAAGQPTPDDLARLARAGVRTVINLRAPGEAVDFDEPAEVERLGLRYVSLPVAGAADLSRVMIEHFGRALDEARRVGGVLIHCASANRVGALVALDDVLNRGLPLNAALERGRAAGLAALQPAVIALAQDGAMR